MKEQNIFISNIYDSICYTILSTVFVLILLTLTETLMWVYYYHLPLTDEL